MAFKTAFVVDLVAEQILHVEDVDDLLAVGRDFGARYLQVELRQRARQIEQQARPVAAIDLDDRVRAARRVVDEDARRHGEDLRPARDRRRLVQLDMRLDPARHHVLEHDRELGELLGPVEGAALGVLHQERVERHPVRQGQDLGVDDVGAGERQRARDAREQARMIGRVERHLGDRAREIDARV